MTAQDSCSAKTLWLKLSLSINLRPAEPTTACLSDASSYFYLPFFLSSYLPIFLSSNLPPFPSCPPSSLPSCLPSSDLPAYLLLVYLPVYFIQATQPSTQTRSRPRDFHVNQLSHSCFRCVGGNRMCSGGGGGNFHQRF